jgi:hypothetical protein
LISYSMTDGSAIAKARIFLQLARFLAAAINVGCKLLVAAGKLLVASFMAVILAA